LHISIFTRQKNESCDISFFANEYKSNEYKYITNNKFLLLQLCSELYFNGDLNS